MITKKVKLKLVGVDGNAFAIMGAFQQQAKREGWTDEEIKAVLTEAKSGHSYEHLVSTIADHCHDPVTGRGPKKGMAK